MYPEPMVLYTEVEVFQTMATENPDLNLLMNEWVNADLTFNDCGTIFQRTTRFRIIWRPGEEFSFYFGTTLGKLVEEKA
jgi:hypothetical protein